LFGDDFGREILQHEIAASSRIITQMPVCEGEKQLFPQIAVVHGLELKNSIVCRVRHRQFAG